MQAAIREWLNLYYGTQSPGEDAADRLAVLVVSKLCRTVFAEYESRTAEALAPSLQALDAVRVQAMQYALVGGECLLKPVLHGRGFDFVPIRRDCYAPLGRDYLLLERRTAGADGLTIETRLFELAGEALGREVPLATLPATAQLQPSLLLPGVRGAQVNPRIGTALVTYDANRTNREEILRWIATAVDTGLELAQEVDWTRSDVGEEELATMARRRLALRLGQTKK